jgi:cytochrome P450
MGNDEVTTMVARPRATHPDLRERLVARPDLIRPAIDELLRLLPFDLGRGSRRHLGMGAGAHSCFGGWLATSISTVTIEELLARCSNVPVDQERVVVGENRSNLTALSQVPAHVGEPV